MAVIPNLSSLRCTIGDIVLSLLPQRAEVFLLMQTGWNCHFTRKGTCGLYRSLWSQFEFCQKRVHWSVSSLPGVFAALWETSLALLELWDHRDNFPQFLLFHPTITTPPHPGTSQNLLIQLPRFNASASSLLAEAWMPHVSVNCGDRDSSPAFGELQHLLLQLVVMQWKTEHRAGVPESHQCRLCSPSSSTGWSHTSGRRNLCAQTLKHDSFCDKHQLQALQCANNLFGAWTRKNKAFSIYLFTFWVVPQLMEYRWPITGLLAKIMLNF